MVATADEPDPLPLGRYSLPRALPLTALATTTLGFVKDPLWLTVLAIAAGVVVLQAIAIGFCARYVPAPGDGEGRGADVA
jgi:hypothetical protein